jgi:hypothetical protein
MDIWQVVVMPVQPPTAAELIAAIGGIAAG